MNMSEINSTVESSMILVGLRKRRESATGSHQSYAVTKINRHETVQARVQHSPQGKEQRI